MTKHPSLAILRRFLVTSMAYLGVPIRAPQLPWFDALLGRRLEYAPAAERRDRRSAAASTAPTTATSRRR